MKKCAPTARPCGASPSMQPSHRVMRPLLPGLVGRNSVQAACGGLDWRFSSPRYLSLLAIPCMFPVSYGLNLTRAREAARCFITGVARGTLALFSRTTGVNCGPVFGSLTGCSVRGRLLAQGVARRVWLRRCIDDHLHKLHPTPCPKRCGRPLLPVIILEDGHYAVLGRLYTDL